MNIKSNLPLFSMEKLCEVVANRTPEPWWLVLSAKNTPCYNGEEEIRGSVAKIKWEFISSDLAKTLEKSGADIHQLKTNTLQVKEIKQFNMIPMAEQFLPLRHTKGRTESIASPRLAIQ